MPATTVGERVVRAKILSKVLGDFGEAAVAGAKAVVGGFVTPINPDEARRNHVYVFNNIFFSYALDTQNTFKVVGGDGPAFKNATHEVRNIVSLNKLLSDAADNAAVTAAAAAASEAAAATLAEGGVTVAGIDAAASVPKPQQQQQLYTLATSVIDYLGVRLVAQSVIPGILSGDQQSRLMYGSVEPGVKLQAKEEMHALLKQASNSLFLAERDVPVLPVRASKGKKNEGGEKVEGEGKDGKEGGEEGQETIKFVGPVEWKGIKGADARCYLLDLVRLTPRDPNWIKENWEQPQGSGTGVWERTKPMEGVPALEDDFSVVLRPELLRLFVRSKVMGLREKIVGAFKAKQKKEKGEEKEGDEEEEELTLDKATKEKLKEEEEELLERMKINPNAFLPLEGITDLDQLAKDEEQIRVLGRYLWHDLLPAFVEDVKTGVLNPIDGETLTANLHQSGINIRYLGRLAQLAQEGGKEERKGSGGGKRFRVPEYFVQLCETEMIARAVKHLVFDLLKNRPDLRMAPAATLVACLNAVLGTVEAKEPSEAARVVGASGGKKKKKKKAPSASANASSLVPLENAEAAAATAAPAPAPAAAAAGGTGGSGGKKGKGKKSKASKEMNGTPSSPPSLSATTSSPAAAAAAAAAAAEAAATAAAFFSAPTEKSPPSTPGIELSLEELRGRVIADIRQRYRYSSSTLLKAGGGTPSKNPYALLRRVCQKLGLRIYARAYDLSSNKREPFSVRDIAEVSPVAKHCLPSSVLDEAKDLVHSATVLMQTGNVAPAFQYVSEATELFTQTLGPIHTEVAHCLELSGTILCQAGDPEAGIGQIEKALVIYWQTAGFDSFEAINAHHVLGLFLQQVQKGGKYDQAVFHFHACIYLLEMIAGPYSPELPPQYLKLSSAYQELGHVKEAYQCLVLAFDKSQHHPDRVTEAQMVHQLAVLEASCTLYKEALTHEKRAYVIFRDILGEEHPRVAEASRFMTELTQKAVERATTKQAQALAANAALAAAVAAEGKGRVGGAGGKNNNSSGNSSVSTGAPVVAPDNSWVTDVEATEQARVGGGGKKKKGGKKR